MSLEIAKSCAPGKFISHEKYRLYSLVDSTMTVADQVINAALSGMDLDGITIISHQQSSGIGSNGRAWVSPPGNAYITRIVETRGGEFGQEMEMAAACAAFEVLQGALQKHERDRLSLKYPNDFLLDGIKLGGCLVFPSYDDPSVCHKTRYVSVGVGVNLQVAPKLPSGRPTTSLADHKIQLWLADFAEKFADKFTHILDYYRKERDFNVVLARMGFLDSDGCLTLWDKELNNKFHGRYAGFRVTDGKTSLLFSDGRSFNVHAHSITNAPQRHSRYGTPQIIAPAAHA